jgi:hypothetical protein
VCDPFGRLAVLKEALFLRHKACQRADASCIPIEISPQTDGQTIV